MVFIDESGTHLGMERDYARSPKGERAYDSKPAHPRGIQNIVGALGFNGLRTSMVTGDSIDGGLFLAFVTEFLLPTLNSGDIVITDNHKIHRVAGVQEKIEASGASYLFLPRYSPDLSPIEEFWSKVKSYLRKIGARTKEVLAKATVEAFDTVILDDIKGWFKHCGYCT